MSDFEKLINASDLIEWIMETYPDWCVGDVRSIVEHVKELPSAEITEEQAIDKLHETGWMQNHDKEMTNSRWIPCSERLPEEDRMVLTTIRGTDLIVQEVGETLEEAVKKAREYVRVSVGFFTEDGWYGADGFPEIVQPVAWLPLPTPYEVEDD